MVAYILTFISGGIISVTLLLLHQHSVKRAVDAEITKARGRFNALSDENDRLRGQINALNRDRADSSGYRRGVEDGYKRGKNVHQWEILENTLNGDGKRSVQIGGGPK